MDIENLSDWVASLPDFFEPFAALFERSETRENVQRYMRALLADVQRKNVWQMAEVLGLSDPHPLQRVLNEAKWDASKLRQHLRQVISETMGYEPGIGVIDESGFVKWGQKSAGVSRQYCGRIGKIENCQVGVYLAYVTARSAAFLDCQLYLPESWCDDRERCRAAKIPDEVSFQTKPQIAQAMLEQAWAEGLPMKWVVGDSLYGNSPKLRNAIHQQDRYYVLGLGSHHHIQIAASEQSLPLKTLPQHLASKDWEQMCFRMGEKGLICYEWQAQRIRMPNDEIGEQWLLIQRSLTDAPQPQYRFYLSNAPDDTSLIDLVAVALSRHPIEELFEEAKSDVGMADYEVRHWHSWHRHMSLVMLAHSYLKFIQYQQREKKPITPFLELQPV